ncbi:hypothetical protein DVR12_14660 [Chitinophaga silvatica]|uniref:MORN repeat variant n=1 Tax=Chitinophaga silvatica TaxID=2282649 RepID=A0A3E1Y924_9BACT|nr:hypothetical protein [Chitinophaga silvatica]RFS21890.1 hypothetical protein DVR12_14660 [Chitinophaga silvatica]
MKEYLSQLFIFSVIVIGVSACQPKELILSKWPGGQKQATVKIFMGDTTFLLDAFYCAYYPNGKVWKTGYFKKNLEEGKWMYFYQSGNKKCYGEFMSGRKMGSYQTYYESGEVEQKGMYVNDKLVDYHYYNPDGTIKPQNEDLSRLIVAQPQKWTEMEKNEIWITTYAAVASTYLHSTEFCDCVVNLLEKKCNFQDIKTLTDKQLGDLLIFLSEKKLDCFHLLEKPLKK